MLKKYLGYYRQLSLSKKAAIWYVVCNMLQKGVAFLVIPLYVRFLSTSEYGQYTIFQSWCNIIIIFATMNLYCGVFTKAMVDYSDDRDRYTSTMQGLSTIITTLLFIIYLLFQKWWHHYLEMDEVTTILMFLYFIAFPSFSFWAVRQRVENKYLAMVGITLLQSVATPIISIFLLFNTNLRANAVIWGFLLTQTGFGLFFYFYHFIKCRCFFDKTYWLHALKFNLPLIPHYLSLIVLGQVDRILIGRFCGKNKAAIYGLAFQVAMTINIVINGINGSFVPWLYEKFKTKSFGIIKKQSNLLCLLVGVITVLAMLVAPEIIRIMGTREYYDAIWIIPPVCVGIYFQFCYGLFSCVEFYYSATKYVMIATTSCACLSVIINILLLPKYGFLSAGYTSLICYTVFMLMHYSFMQKVSKVKLDGISIYDIRFIIITCSVQMLIMITCLFLYYQNAIRYIVLSLMLISLVVIRNRFKTIINVKK